jgi:hypothetical protein
MFNPRRQGKIVISRIWWRHAHGGTLAEAAMRIITCAQRVRIKTNPWEKVLKHNWHGYKIVEFPQNLRMINKY